MFEQLAATLKKNRRTIVFTEGEDARILDAATRLLKEDLLDVLLVGSAPAIRAAAELDMRVVLYDEGMYPSGSACGLVVKGHPDLASRGIALTEQPLPGDQVLCRTDQAGRHFGMRIAEDIREV